MGEGGAMSERQRAHPRYDLTSIDAVVAGMVLRVANVSATGVFIEGWSNPPPEGTTGAFTLRTPLLEKVASMEIVGTVVRVLEDVNVALSFEMPRRDWPRLLEFLDRKEREGEA